MGGFTLLVGGSLIGSGELVGTIGLAGERELIAEEYIAEHAEKIADDIVEINKKYSNGFQQNNSVSNTVNSATYYKDPYDQVSSITRSIVQNAFENGNKRTAFDTLNKLIKDVGLKCKLTDAQKWDLINNVAEGKIKNVTDISRVLQGK